MQSDGVSVHRKLTLHEWSDTATTVAPSPQRPGVALAPSTAAAAATTAPLRELYECAMACTERKAYLVGGYDARSHRNVRQVVEWDLHTRQWSRQADLPEALTQAAAVAVDDVCFVWGGWTGSSYSDRLWLLASGDVTHAMRRNSSSSSNNHSGSGAAADAHATRASLLQQQQQQQQASASSPAASPHRGVSLTRAAKDATASSGNMSNGGSGSGGGGDMYHWTLLPPLSSSSSMQRNEPCAPAARCGHSFVLGSAPAHLCPANEHNSSNDDYDNNDDGSGTATDAREPVAYLFGGFDGARRRNDVWRLWLRASTRRRGAVWQRVYTHDSSSDDSGGGGIAPAPRDAAALAYDATRHCLYVFGGFASTLMNDVHVLELEDCHDGHDTSGNEDTTTANAHVVRRPRWVALHYATGGGGGNGGGGGALVPSRRQGCIAAVSGNYLVVCSGGSAGGDDGGAALCSGAASSLPLLQLSLTELRWSSVATPTTTTTEAAAMEMLAGRSGCVGCAGDRSRRLLVYGGGDVAHYRTSVVEIELDKLDAAGGSGGGGGGKKK